MLLNTAGMPLGLGNVAGQVRRKAISRMASHGTPSGSVKAWLVRFPRGRREHLFPLHRPSRVAETWRAGPVALIVPPREASMFFAQPAGLLRSGAHVAHRTDATVSACAAGSNRHNRPVAG